jgi:hypothetical protein
LPYAKPVPSSGRRRLHVRHLHLGHELHRTSALGSKPRTLSTANSCGKHSCEHRPFLAVPQSLNGSTTQNRCAGPALSAHACVDERQHKAGTDARENADTQLHGRNHIAAFVLRRTDLLHLLEPIVAPIYGAGPDAILLPDLPAPTFLSAASIASKFARVTSSFGSSASAFRKSAMAPLRSLRMIRTLPRLA